MKLRIPHPIEELQGAHDLEAELLDNRQVIDCMSETNAASYELESGKRIKNGMLFTLKGVQLEDAPFCGDRITVEACQRSGRWDVTHVEVDRAYLYDSPEAVDI